MPWTEAAEGMMTLPCAAVALGVEVGGRVPAHASLASGVEGRTRRSTTGQGEKIALPPSVMAVEDLLASSFPAPEDDFLGQDTWQDMWPALPDDWLAELADCSGGDPLPLAPQPADPWCAAAAGEQSAGSVQSEPEAGSSALTPDGISVENQAGLLLESSEKLPSSWMIGSGSTIGSLSEISRSCHGEGEGGCAGGEAESPVDPIPSVADTITDGTQKVSKDCTPGGANPRMPDPERSASSRLLEPSCQALVKAPSLADRLRLLVKSTAKTRDAHPAEVPVPAEQPGREPGTGRGGENGMNDRGGMGPYSGLMLRDVDPEEGQVAMGHPGKVRHDMVGGEVGFGGGFRRHVQQQESQKQSSSRSLNGRAAEHERQAEGRVNADSETSRGADTGNGHGFGNTVRRNTLLGSTTASEDKLAGGGKRGCIEARGVAPGRGQENGGQESPSLPVLVPFGPFSENQLDMFPITRWLGAQRRTRKRSSPGLNADGGLLCGPSLGPSLGPAPNANGELYGVSNSGEPLQATSLAASWKLEGGAHLQSAGAPHASACGPQASAYVIIGKSTAPAATSDSASEPRLLPDSSILVPRVMGSANLGIPRSVSLAADSAPIPPPTSPALRIKVHSQLLSLAEAYATDQPMRIKVLTERLRSLASLKGCPTRKIAFYSLKALELRYSGYCPKEADMERLSTVLTRSQLEAFVSLAGWLPLARVTTTHALLRALRGFPKVHIILLNDAACICWRTLLRGLAGQAGGAPEIKVTSINFFFPAPSASDSPTTPLVRELAETSTILGVPVVHRHVRVPHYSFHPGMVAVGADEAVAAVACWTLMVFPDGRLLKSDPRTAMLKWLHALSPKVFVMTEHDFDFNSPFFLARVKEMTQRAFPLFEDFDRMAIRESSLRPTVEAMLAVHVIHCIACEGLNRVLRMERMEQWFQRMESVGFAQCRFPDEVWDDLARLSNVNPDMKLMKSGEAARLMWHGVPHLFSAAWVPTT